MDIEDNKKIMNDTPNRVRLSSLLYHFEPNIWLSASLEESDVDKQRIEVLQEAGFKFDYWTQMDVTSRIK